MSWQLSRNLPTLSMTASPLFRPETQKQKTRNQGRKRCGVRRQSCPAVVLLMKAHPQEQGPGHSAPSPSTTRRRNARDRVWGVGEWDAVIAPPASSSTTPSGAPVCPATASAACCTQVRGGTVGTEGTKLPLPLLFPSPFYLFSPLPPPLNCQHLPRESLTRPRLLLPLHIPLHSFSGHSLFSRRRDRFDPAASIITTWEISFALVTFFFFTTTR